MIRRLPSKTTMVLLLMILVFTACSILYISGVTSRELKEQSRDELGRVSAVIAQNVDGDALRSIKPGDEDSPQYGALSEILKKSKENLPDIKYIYLMKKEGSSVVFVVDPDEDNPAAIGEEYPNPTLRMLEGFERTAVDDDLTTDEWGTVLSAYSPVRDQAGNIVAILGVDMTQERLLARQNLISWTSYMIIILGLLMAVFGVIGVERVRTKLIEDLTEREKRFRTLFESTYDAILILRDGKIIDCNIAAQHLFGMEKTQVIGNSPADLSPSQQADGSDSHEKMNGYLKEAVEGKLPRFVWIHRTTNGRVFDAEIGLTRIDLEGSVAVQAVIRDITEKKRAEDALRSNEKYLNLIFSSIHTGLMIIEAGSHRIVDVNPIAAKMIGLPKEKIVGHVCHKFICPAEAGKCPVTDLGKSVDNTERVMITASGDNIPVLKTVVPITLDNQQYLLESYVDISDRKKAEEALRESEKKYRVLTESSPEAIFTVDSNHTVIYANTLASRLLSEGLQSVIDDGKKRADGVNTIQHVLDSGEILRQEDRLVCRNGKEIWLESTFTPLTHEDGTVTAILAVSHDITERKSMQTQIEASLHEKEYLLKEIHHRVKNNLQVISSLLSMQSRKATDPKEKETLTESQNRVKSIALVHEGLYQSKSLDKIDYGEYLRKLVTHLFESFSIDPARIKRTISAKDVYVNIDQAVPCSLILNEMLTNSFKYAFPEGRSGEITILFTLEGTNYTLDYRDNGVGIPEGTRLERSGSLGMQLITGLTRQLDGNITIDTTSGVHYTIIFPKKQKGE